MGLVVNTNVNSSKVQRALTKATSEIGNAYERLSTGYRINKAADDAAGLTISEGLRSQSRGASVATNNAQTGVNLLQTAEADLTIIQDNLQRIRDLTLQAANGTYATAERSAIQSEVQARIDEINRLAKSSKFNNINLLNGASTSLTLQIGANSVASLNSLDIGSALGEATVTSLGLTTSLSTAYSSCTNAASFLTEIDTAIAEISARRSQIGSLQNRLDSTISSLDVKVENLDASESRIRDTDIAQTTADFTKYQILQQSATMLLAQANQAPSIALSLLGA